MPNTKPSKAQRKAQSRKDSAKAKSTKPKKASKRQSGSGLSSGRISAPASSFTVRTPKFEISKSAKGSDAIRIKGQDFIAGMVIPSGTVPGSLIYNVGINPLIEAFEGTRLAKFAQLYEKYVFRMVQFHVQSSAPSSASGSYILAYDRDIADDTPSASNLGLKTYYGMKNTKSASIWQDCTINCPLDDTQDFYYTNYTGYDARLTHQGQIYIAALAPLTAGVSINLWVSYDIDLMVPELEEQTSAATTNMDISFVATGSNNVLPDPVNDYNLLKMAKAVSRDQLVGDTKTMEGASLDLEAGNPDEVAYELPQGTYDMTLNVSAINKGDGTVSIAPRYRVIDKGTSEELNPYKVIQQTSNYLSPDYFSESLYRAVYEIGKAGARIFPLVATDGGVGIGDLFTWMVPSGAQYLKGGLFNSPSYIHGSGDLTVKQPKKSVATTPSTPMRQRRV